MQVLHQLRQNVLTKGGYMSRTPHHSNNIYPSAKPSVTQPSSEPRDYFKVQTKKYPSKLRLFLWIVIEEGVKTFTLRIYNHHINNYWASYNCCVLPGSRNDQDCDETMQVNGIKTHKNIDTIKGIRYF
ncbi:hypothetical protein MKX03_014119 [Papaver bracteatum]|nr:hypothetical protein MKX03_014119 [Papaver bracteatum]